MRKCVTRLYVCQENGKLLNLLSKSASLNVYEIYISLGYMLENTWCISETPNTINYTNYLIIYRN